MTKVLMILLAALMFEAMGVVFLSRGLKEIGEVNRISASEIAMLLKRGASHPAASSSWTSWPCAWCWPH